jgi:hypothetical protein
MIAATTSTTSVSELRRLWIGTEEVATEGRSIVQCLDSMRSDNWELESATVNLHLYGALCIYNFKRRLPA